MSYTNLHHFQHHCSASVSVDILLSIEHRNPHHLSLKVKVKELEPINCSDFQAGETDGDKLCQMILRNRIFFGNFCDNRLYFSKALDNVKYSFVYFFLLILYSFELIGASDLQ